MPSGVYVRTKEMKIGKGNKGVIPWNKGLTKKTDERILKASKNNSIGQLKYCETHVGNFTGHHHTEIGINNLIKGQNKYYETHVGLRTGKHCTEESCKKMSESHIGFKPSDITCEKLRLIRVKQLEDKFGAGCPAFNKKACKVFEMFDIIENTKGRYATNCGEYKTKNGYFLDYINFDLKLIIEWDEPKHYKRDGTLKDKDVKRQKNIQELFPDFEFVRMKELELK